MNDARLCFANLRDTTIGGYTLLVPRPSHMAVMRAELSGTDFDCAIFGNTILTDVDLSQVKGLETVEHRLPSTIGIDTIYSSEGKIPE